MSKKIEIVIKEDIPDDSGYPSYSEAERIAARFFKLLIHYENQVDYKIYKKFFNYCFHQGKQRQLKELRPLDSY